MFLRIAALLGLAFLPACATITTSPSQNLTVLTEPAGARCEIERNGAPLAVVNPTPGTVRIGKSNRETTITCTRDGHLPAQTALSPEFQPMFLGNILLGGVVGIVVDVSTGAISKYPDSIQIALTPASPAPSGPVISDLSPANPPAQTSAVRHAGDDRVATIRAACGPSGCGAPTGEAGIERKGALAMLGAEPSQPR